MFLQSCAPVWRRCPTLFVHSKLSAHACAEFCEGKIYDNSVHSVLFSRVDRFGTRVCQICISICDGVCGRDVKFKKQAQEAEQVGTQSAPSRGTQLVTEPKGLFRSESYRFVMFRAQRKSFWAPASARRWNTWTRESRMSRPHVRRPVCPGRQSKCATGQSFTPFGG